MRVESATKGNGLLRLPFFARGAELHAAVARLQHLAQLLVLKRRDHRAREVVLRSRADHGLDLGGGMVRRPS